LWLVGCGSSGGESGADAGSAGDGASALDGSLGMDAPSTADAFAGMDAQTTADAAPPVDTGLAWTSDPDGGCPSPGPPYGGGEPVVEGGVVHAALADLTGAPLAGFFVQICGINTCAAPNATSDAGVVTVDTTRYAIQKPVFGYGDALHFPLLLLPVPSGPSIDLGTLVTAPLPPAGAPFTTGGDAVSGDVTVSLAPGGVAMVDTHVYDTTDKQTLRAVTLPVAKEGAIPGVASHGLALLYGVSPIDTLFCPAARVTVANRAGWPAGARVGFYLLGDDTAQPWAPYGEWALISHGAVSSDGTTIRTNDGEGFPLLEAFGVRLEP
jgi:hypothetical protein